MIPEAGTGRYVRPALLGSCPVATFSSGAAGGLSAAMALGLSPEAGRQRGSWWNLPLL